MSDYKYDRRQSGRTTKCLMAACKRAAATRSQVVYVMPSIDVARFSASLLAKIDPTGRYDATNYIFKLGGGGEVCLITISRPAVKGPDLSVKGYGVEAVFFDHEAVRLLHNKVISEFHKYD